MGHIERAVRVAVLVREGANAAANGQRYKHGLRGLLEHLDHGHVLQGEVSKARDIEEGDLICALLIVSTCQVHRLAKVAHLARFTHVILVPLGHHQITCVIGPDVQARNDALGQARARAIHRHGVAGFSVGLEEVVKQLKAELSALFRVKLSGHDIARLYTADKFIRIVRGRQDNVVAVRGHVKGVDKVKLLLACQAIEQARRLPGPQPVPPDVRDRQVGLESLDSARDDTQARHARGLFTGFKQDLQTQAYAEVRPVLPEVCLERLRVALVVQGGHHAAEVAHARADQLVGVQDVIGVLSHVNRVTELANRVDHASDIAGTVV